MITGLKFGTSEFQPDCSPCEPPQDSVYKRSFDGQAVVAGDLLNRFKNGEFRSRPDDAVKISYILLLTLYLFGMDVRTPVPHWLWSLVEQATIFDKFPWGSYCFQRLMHYLDRSLHPLPSGAPIPLYHLYGYQIALQIWAFECIPEFGSQVGEKKSDEFPRGIRWRSPGKRPSIPDIFNARTIECIQLEPTQTETASPYMADIEMDILSGVRFIHQDRPIGRSVGGSRMSRSDTVRSQETKRRSRINKRDSKRTKIDRANDIAEGGDEGNPPAATNSSPLAPPPPAASCGPPPPESRDDSKKRRKSKKLSARATSEFLRTELKSMMSSLIRESLPDVLRDVMLDIIRQSLPNILRDLMPDFVRQLLPEVVRQMRETESSIPSKETESAQGLRAHSPAQTSDFVYGDTRFPILLDQQSEALAQTSRDVFASEPLQPPPITVLER